MLDVLKNLLAGAVVPAVQLLVSLLSAPLKAMLTEFAVSFYKKAKTTENPWDDLIAALLLAVLSIPTPTDK